MTPYILFEDNHLMVVEKPINIPVQEDESRDPDLLSELKIFIKERDRKPGNVFLGLVHRLDRPVGGVMVFAKTSKAAARLSEQIRNRTFEKIYLAIVHEIPTIKQGRLVHFLEKNERTNTVYVTEEANSAAKKAILNYELIETKDELSLIKIQLETGRSHQIRVQFTEIGHPLWGDQKYGKNLNKPGQQLALWATELSFEHPTKKEELAFFSNPPKIFPWNLFPNQKTASF